MTTFTLNAMITLAIASMVIPIVTALLTKYAANPFVKQIATAALAALVTLFNQGLNQTGQDIISTQALLMWAFQWVTASVVYVIGYKPHSLNAKAAPRFGVGSSKGDLTHPDNVLT